MSGFAFSWSPHAHGALSEPDTNYALGVWSDANRGAGVRVEVNAARLRVTVGRPASRPCFVHRNAEGRWFCGSSLEQLVAVYRADATNAARSLAIAPDGLAGRVLFLGAETSVPYTDVLRLRSGTVAEIDAHGIRIQACPPPPMVDQVGNAPALARNLWNAVCGSVERACAGASTIAVMVGGGVDSSALLVAAREVAAGRTVIPLTWAFAGKGDDRPYMQVLARALRLDPVALKSADAAAEFAQSLVVGGAPYGLVAGAMERATMKRARELGADVLLTGIGGDEILAGSLHSAMWNGVPRLDGVASSLRAALSLALPHRPSLRDRTLDFVLRPLLRAHVSASFRADRRNREVAAALGVLGPRSRRALSDLCLRDAQRAWRNTPQSRYQQFAEQPIFDEYADLRSQLEDATGMRREDPYLDDELLEFIATIPPRMLLHGGFHRGLFRLAIEDKLPKSIAYRADKAHFEEVIASFIEQAQSRSLLAELACAMHLSTFGVVDGVAFKQRIDAILRESDPARFGAGIAEMWPVLAAEAFLREPRPAAKMRS